MRRSLVLLVLLGLGTVGCDQVTKQAAVTHLEGEPSIELFGGAARFAYAENRGAFLGLGDQLPDAARIPLLVVVNLGILLALGLWAFRRKQSALVRAAATLVIAGGVGNMIDRVLREGGRVVDFMMVGAGPVRTGIFNVADVAVMAGVILLLFAASRRAPASGVPG